MCLARQGAASPWDYMGLLMLRISREETEAVRSSLLCGPACDFVFRSGICPARSPFGFGIHPAPASGCLSPLEPAQTRPEPGPAEPVCTEQRDFVPRGSEHHDTRYRGIATRLQSNVINLENTPCPQTCVIFHPQLHNSAFAVQPLAPVSFFKPPILTVPPRRTKLSSCC